jgi:FeS assembly protein IscX
MKWTDTNQIAQALAERFPTVDPKTIRFTDLHRWVCELPGFSDRWPGSRRRTDPAPRCMPSEALAKEGEYG